MEHIVIGKNKLDSFIKDFINEVNNGDSPDYIQHIISFGDNEYKRLGLELVYNTTSIVCGKNRAMCRLFIPIPNTNSEHNISNVVYKLHDDMLHGILWDVLSPLNMLKYGIDLELKPFDGGDLDD